MTAEIETNNCADSTLAWNKKRKNQTARRRKIRASGAIGVGANLRDEIERVVRGESDDASRILGPHWVERDGKRVLVVRAFRPGAMEASIFWRGNSEAQAMTEIHPGGVFEALAPSRVADSREEAVAPLA